MVCANYCAPYPNWPWVLHEASMCCPCCMTSLYSSPFYFILLGLVISLVTTPSIVLGVATHCNKCTTIASYIEIRSVQAQFHSSSKQFSTRCFNDRHSAQNTNYRVNCVSNQRLVSFASSSSLPPSLPSPRIQCANGRKVILIRLREPR